MPLLIVAGISAVAGLVGGFSLSNGISSLLKLAALAGAGFFVYQKVVEK